MKTLFENFVNCVVFVIMIFTIAAFSVTEMEVMTARHIHTSIVNQYQSSYHTLNIDAVNEKLQQSYPNWEVEVSPVDSAMDRETVLVTLHYNVILPVFGIEREGVIDGYAS